MKQEKQPLYLQQIVELFLLEPIAHLMILIVFSFLLTLYIAPHQGAQIFTNIKPL